MGKVGESFVDLWPGRRPGLRLVNGAFGLQNRQARCLSYAYSEVKSMVWGFFAS